MNDIILVDTFNTSMGLILSVKNDRKFEVGQTVTADNENYLIKGISFSLKSFENGNIFLAVSKLE